MSLGNPIVICEPQCWDFEHYLFNAALLQTALLAFPDQPVIFAAERGHLQTVRRALTEHGADAADRITWREIAIADRRSQGWSRLPSELQWVRLILKLAADANARSLIVSSISEAGLIAVKWRLRARDAPRIPVLVVPHGMLSSLLVRGSRRPAAWTLHLRQALKLPHPKQLHYIALGASIHRTLQVRFPRIAVHFSPMDHPWLWARNTSTSLPGSPSPVSFGYFGAAYKGGLDLFERLAQAVRKETNRGEFVLIGYVAKGEPARPGYVKGVAASPLSSDEYDRRAASIQYAVWTANPESYRLAASASFLDALSYVKPGLYLRNDYVEHYFRQLGDIGYLCEGYDDLEAAARSIVREFPLERYQRQCANILRGRKVFDPQTVAPQLRGIVTACENGHTS